MRDDIDPLDVSDPARAAWQRFRTRFATARLLEWLFAEVEEKHPDYFSDLYHRLQSSWDHGETLKADGLHDGWMPLVDLQGVPAGTWIREEDLSQICDELFPHGPADTPRFANGASLVVLLLYGALESLAGELRLHDSYEKKANVVSVLNTELDLRDLDSEAFDDLVDLRETRNLVAHNGGVVDQGYRSRVRRTVFEEGEDRAVSPQELNRFSRAVMWAAQLAYRLAGGTTDAT